MGKHHKKFDSTEHELIKCLRVATAQELMGLTFYLEAALDIDSLVLALSRK